MTALVIFILWMVSLPIAIRFGFRWGSEVGYEEGARSQHGDGI